VLEDYGLVAALRKYAAEMETRTNITTVLHSKEPIPRLSSDRELALFRIAREALINAAKHSGAKNVTVTLDCTDTTIRLTICDDGKGFVQPVVLQPGIAYWGLAIMRERTEMLGGKFLLETAPGTGARIYLEIPKEKSDGDQSTDC
jgi:signal transduction histidine kinase